MATVTTNYTAAAAIVMDVANLASSATFVAGRESTQVDNTSNKYVDALVFGRVSVGTTPTANTSILVYVYAGDVSLATTAVDVLDGTDSAETLTNVGILGALKLGAIVSVPANTSDVAYEVQPFSVAQLFGGVMPKFWGLYLTHNTGVNLRNTTVNTDEFSYAGIKIDVA